MQTQSEWKENMRLERLRDTALSVQKAKTIRAANRQLQTRNQKLIRAVRRLSALLVTT